MSEKSLRERLVGAWALTSYVERDVETGVENHPFGEHPLGFVLYTPDGYVSAQLQLSENLRATRKSSRPSPRSGGHEGRIFEAGHRRSRQIAAYYARSGNPAVAERIVVRIHEAVVQITGSPLSGRSVVQRSGVRVVLVVNYRYKIFYRVAGDTIHIIHIRHASRRPYD
jgi:toxin ParE1/3/4